MSLVWLALGVLAPPLAEANPSYHALRRTWTKGARIYNLDTMDAVLIWKATFLSPEFQEAFRDRHGLIKHLSESEALRFRMEQEEKTQCCYEFFVSLYTKKDYKNFSLGADSFWQVALIGEDGKEIVARSVEVLPNDPYWRKMFPTLNRWSKPYRVLFPKENLGNSWTLHLRSVAGSSELRWALK